MPMSMNFDKYIGQRISLISKLDIRYEGILHSMNPEDATIILQEVQCMGTEGRSRYNNVPKSNKIHDYIVFRGSDIKDIAFDDGTSPDESDPVFNDPAVCKTYRRNDFDLVNGLSTMSIARKPTDDVKETFPKLDLDSGVNFAKNMDLFENLGEKIVASSRCDSGVYGSKGQAHEGPSGSTRGSLKNFDLGESVFMDSPDLKEVERYFAKSINRYDEEIDSVKDGSVVYEEERFAKGSEVGRRGELAVVGAGRGEGGGSERFYQKSSFYDNITNESRGETKTRLNRRKQHELDTVTFGEVHASNYYKNQNRRRFNKPRTKDKNPVKAGWEKEPNGN